MFYDPIKKLLNHGGIRRYGSNMSWMVSARAINSFIAFFSVIYIVRKLGPENYGQLSYAVSFVGIFSFLASLGLDQILFRELINHPDKRDDYLSTTLFIKIAGGIITILIVFVSAYFFSPRDISVYLIFLLSLTYLFTPWNVIGYYFQARAEIKYPSILSILVSLIINAFKLLIIFLGKGIIYISLAIILDPILIGLGSIMIYKKINGALFPLVVKWDIVKKMLSQSWPLMFSAAFAIIYSRIDQIMIKNMLNTSSVGIYDAAVRIAEMWYFIPTIIITALFPAIMNAKKVSELLYFQRIKKLFLLLLGISSAVGLIITLAAPFIIKILYGREFIQSVPILQIYVWSGVSISLFLLAQHFLLAEERQGIIFISSLSAMIVNILLNIYLIPRWGIKGAAWATFISYFFTVFALLLFPETRSRLYSVLKGRASN